MSIRPHKCLSPTKENMSPTKHASKSGQSINDFLSFIKASGVKLPAHIQKALQLESGGLLKMVPAETSSPKEVQSIQKLKLKLGDTQFELKKMEEDFAQYKLNSRIEKQKECKRWEEAFNNLRNNLDFANEQSSMKLIKIRETTQKQIQSLKQKHQNELKQEKQKLVKSYEEKLASLKKVGARQMKQLKEKSAQDIKNLKEKFQDQIKDLKDQHEGELKKLNLKFKETIDQKERVYESTYTALQCEKRTQEKLHEKTKIEANQAKEKLYSELYYERNLKINLEQTLQKKQLDIKALKLQIHNLQIDIILQKQRNEKKEQMLRDQFNKEKKQMQNIHRSKLCAVLTDHGKELKKHQQSIKQINQWKENKQVLMKQRYEDIQMKFQDRPSRQQDLDMIEKLRGKLHRKQQELRMLNKELRMCVLESENKQQTYNKIFTSNTVNKLQKKCLSKDREDLKSKQSLCRKSQTTDIKFLLKIYNKNL